MKEPTYQNICDILQKAKIHYHKSASNCMPSQLLRLFGLEAVAETLYETINEGIINKKQTLDMRTVSFPSTFRDVVKIVRLSTHIKVSDYYRPMIENENDDDKRTKLQINQEAALVRVQELQPNVIKTYINCLRSYTISALKIRIQYAFLGQ